eukprot:5047834-Alexandrium_andersonii.AAC.1
MRRLSTSVYSRATQGHAERAPRTATGHPFPPRPPTPALNHFPWGPRPGLTPNRGCPPQGPLRPAGPGRPQPQAPWPGQ